MVKKILRCAYDGILPCNKKKWTDAQNMNESQSDFAEQKKPDTKKHIPFKSIYMNL